MARTAASSEIMQAENLSIAMLIDGDNARPSLIGQIVAEAARFGTITVRRIYGDWTTPNMSGWKASLHAHAVQPIQQFRYTTGKNATDSALIIDAMDLLHSGMVNAFCIVSSDSDFTRLATRIREQGLFVMGIGRKGTPKAFVNACERFVYTENLGSSDLPKDADGTVPSEASPWTDMVRECITKTSADDEWVDLGVVGSYIRKLDPAFDSRTFGHKKLSELIKSRSDLFETRRNKTEAGTKVVTVRAKAVDKSVKETSSQH